MDNEIKIKIDQEENESNKFHIKKIEEIFEQFSSRPTGLSKSEVQSRTSLGQKNALKEEEKDPLWKRYLEQYQEPLIILLLVSAVISIIIGQWDDAISIVLAVVIVSTVGFIQEYRSEQSLEALTKFVEKKCLVLRDSQAVQIDAENLVLGDIILLEPGIRVPADARLFEVNDLRIDQSILTGESRPSKKHSHILENENASLEERRNLVFMGTLVMSGKGKAVVIAIGDDTELGKISQMIQNTENQKTPLQLKMDELGRHLSFISFGIIGVIFLLGAIQGNSLIEMFNVGVSLAVAAIPEGLPIVVTVTLAIGVTRMARKRAIVKKLPAVEALGGVSVICADKTGTITENKMSVTKFYTTQIISLVHYPNKDVEYLDSHQTSIKPKNDDHLWECLKIGNICNNAHTEFGAIFGNATEAALLSASLASGMDDLRKKYDRIQEIPFDSKTKWMAVKCNYEGHSRFFVKGAVECVLEKCRDFYNPQQNKLEILDASNKLASSGLRVLALASGTDLAQLTFVGLVGIVDPPRFNVKDSVRRAKEAHVSIVMITGDSKETAISTAKEIEIWDQDSISLSGQEIDSLSETSLSEKLDRVHVFYRVTPSQKVKIVQAFRIRGQVVAMTGDGVNDAPALKIADIGIAMGKGSDVSKETAAMILVDNNFSTIIDAIEEGKSIYNNIQNFLRFQLSTSIAALAIMAYCTLFGNPLPFNPMQILFVNIIMDGPPAQSLGLEPLTQSLMKNPPRPPNEPVLNRNIIIKIIVGAFIMLVGTLNVFFTTYNVSDSSSSTSDPTVLSPQSRTISSDSLTQEEYIQRYATTMAFTTFVFFQMFNAFNSRSLTKSVFYLGVFKNQYLLAAVAGSIFMEFVVIYFPFFQYIFETVSISIGDYLYCIAIASTILIIDEFWKFFFK